MAFEPIFMIEGNLLADPELRYTPNGIAVANLRVGINDARPEQNEGKQVSSIVADVAVWRDIGEHTAESLSKGQRIIARVRMTEVGAYLPRGGGDPVGVLKVEALEIGPSLRWATAKPEKAAHGGGRGGRQQAPGQNQQGNQGWGQGGNQGADPWANGSHPNQQQSSGGGKSDGWGSDQGWGQGGNQGADPWGN